MSILPSAQSEGQNGVTNPMMTIPADTSVDVTSVLQESQVMEVLQKLDQELVGLKSVKTRIREIAALLVIDRLRRGVGLTARPPSLHMSFTGQPGTGLVNSRTPPFEVQRGEMDRDRRTKDPKTGKIKLVSYRSLKSGRNRKILISSRHERSLEHRDRTNG